MRSRNTSVRVGIVGLGIHGMRYARHLLAGDVPGARLTAICRRDVVAGTEFSTAQGITYHREPESLILSAEVDAVVLVLPPTEHPSLGIASLEAGKPVLVEKPLACDLAAAQRVAATVRRTGGHLMMAHTLRFDGVVRRLCEHLPALGAVSLVALSQRFEPFHRDWIDTPGPGGMLLNTAVHGFDLIRHITGAEPVRLSATLGRFHTTRTEDQVACWMRLEPGGILATLDNSRTTGGRNGRIEIAGDQGQLFGDHVLRAAWKVSGPDRIDLGPIAPVPTVRETLIDFIGGIKGGDAPSIDVGDGVATLELVEAARRSHEERRVIELSQTG